MILALLALLTDGVVSIPPSRSTAIDLRVPEHDTTVHCFLDLRAGESPVRAMLLERTQAERYHRGRNARSLYAVEFNRSGNFKYHFDQAGDYVLLIDNRLNSRTAAEVGVKIEITRNPVILVRELPADRRRAVVAISLLFFGAVVVFSARQFLKQ